MRTLPPPPKPKPSQLSQSPLGHLGGPDTAQRHDILLKITQSDAFNYMSYHFLCKRGIRQARTEQFLVDVLVVSLLPGNPFPVLETLIRDLPAHAPANHQWRHLGRRCTSSFSLFPSGGVGQSASIGKWS